MLPEGILDYFELTLVTKDSVGLNIHLEEKNISPSGYQQQELESKGLLPDHMQTTVTNKWVYMKKEFVVPADVVQMFLRLDNNVAGTVWFDDLRIQPSDAAMSTYTYEPLVGMTSAIDDSGKTAYYEYDTFQRLMNIKDQNGFIIKNYDYHYKP